MNFIYFRLGKEIMPVHYDITVQIDVTHEKFSGHETIEVTSDGVNPKIVFIEHGIFGKGSQSSTNQKREITNYCFLASYWLKFGTLSRKFRAL